MLALDTAFAPRLADRLRRAIGIAILAPSTHNSQPWRFHVHDDCIDLYADRARGLPVVDPNDRALIASCGAALKLLRLALRHEGLVDDVETFPNGLSREPLARIYVREGYLATVDDDALYAAISARRSNRGAYRDQPLPDDFVHAMRAVARKEDVELFVAQSPGDRLDVARLVAAGDRMQFDDPHFRRELALWLRPHAVDVTDGVIVAMPEGGGALAELISRATPFIVRTVDVGAGTAAHDFELVAASPLIAAFSTEHDDAPAWLAAGQAVAEATLYAQSLGVASSYVNQPIEVDSLRPRLREMLKAFGYPQLMLRFGYGNPVPASPRRPLAAVLFDG
jgi:hypothetical protein